MSTLLDKAPAMKKLYEKAMQGKWDEMAEDYEKHLQDEQFEITIAGDTAFHLAVHSGKAKPLSDLIEVLDRPDEPFANSWRSITSDSPIVEQNHYGNTVLHEAAINGNIEAAKLLKDRYPSLLLITNALGETPLFTAAAYGTKELVEELLLEPGIFDEDNRLAQPHRKRKNSTTILQATIDGTHFETALLLLKWDDSLAELEDDRGFTALHTLSHMPSAFRSGYRMGAFKRLIYNCFPVEDDEHADEGRKQQNSTPWINTGFPVEDDEDADEGFPVEDEGGKQQSSTPRINTVAKRVNLSICRFFCKGWPIMEDFWNSKKKHKFALKLVESLIDKHFLVDFQVGIIVDSYSSYEPLENKNDGNKDVNSSTDHSQGASHENSDPIPPPVLFGATSHGIREIVEEILEKYPQAVEQLNTSGQNILHIAIMHRQKKIYDLIKHKMRLQWPRLKRRIDNNGYTILHQVANTEKYTGGTKPGPALQLQEELRWFKRIEKAIPSHYLLHRENGGKEPQNKEKLTAEEMFKRNHKDGLQDAQKWIKDTSQSCSTVAVLVATVVFAAAYTVPGDYNTKGIPNFLSNRFFKVFTVFDVVSLAGSLTSLVMFLSILTSPLELYDFHRSLPRKVMFGLTLLFFSVLTTMVAFGSTIAILVQSDQKRTAILISVAACVPVAVFALMLLDLYLSYLSTIKESFKPIKRALPLFCLPSLRRKKNIP